MKEKTRSSVSDVSFNPSSASTPCSDVSVVCDDSLDSFHSLSDQDSQTLDHKSDSTTPQSSSVTQDKKKSPSIAQQLYQEFQSTAQSVALDITKVSVSQPLHPPQEVTKQAPSIKSPCQKHGKVFNFSAAFQAEILAYNSFPFTCNPRLPPKRDPASSLPPVTPAKSRPNLSKGCFIRSF